MLHINGITDRGLLREANEDRFAGEVFAKDMGYAVICDGMGGMNGGSLASSIACEEIRRMVESSLRPQMEQRSVDLLIDSAIENANWMVLEKARQAGPEYLGMGTTLCMALFHGTEVTIANIGDSRCYLLREGELRQLTTDHTVVQQMVQEGSLTPAEAAVHPERHLITRAVGVEENVTPDYISLLLAPGDTLLLCTDGLYNMLPPEELQAALARSVENDDLGELIDEANAAGGLDNITAVVIHNS